MDTASATRLVQRWLDPARRVTDVRQLNGGMINHVWSLRLDGEPGAVVAKLNTAERYAELERESRALNWCREQTSLPVPAVYGCFVDEPADVSGLLLEQIESGNLAEARLSRRGMASVQHQMARHVAELHTHHREAFGPVADERAGQPRWLDVFGPALEHEFLAVREHLNSRSREVVGRVIEELDHWLPEQSRPTLIHGDLWKTNMLVDDAHADRPRLAAFVDPSPIYADPEYELAYLRLFHTADETFFNAYAHQHRPRPGFDRRCRVYWLNTLLRHIRLFGDRYTATCEDVIRQIRRLG